MPIFLNALFLNSAELKRLDTGGAETVVRASHQHIPERYIKIQNSQCVLHTPVTTVPDVGTFPVSTLKRIPGVIIAGILMRGKTDLV